MGCCGGCKCRAKEHRIRQIGPVDEPMASQTQGIQQLLIAEKKAAEKVSEARKRKARRIKQAREEAQADIEKYRQERERVFKEYEDKQLGNREGVAAKIDHDTQDFLDKMNKDLKNNREKVLEELIALVINVQPQVHPNYFVVNPKKADRKT